MNTLQRFVFALALAQFSLSVWADLPVKKVLTLRAAKQIVAAAEAEAKRRGTTVVIAVVDDGGHLLLLERLDDTQVASSEVAIAKARTASIFRRPSKVFEDQVREGRVAAITLPGATPLQGGLPLTVDGQVVGAVGVSGNSPQQDEEIAAVGVAALNTAVKSEPQAVTYVPATDAAAAFAKGAPLKETTEYKVHASRRDAPGIGEVHERDTDVIYMLEGSATFVTGGKLVDPKQTAPDEIRGASIEGGEMRTITRGDVIVVPAGTPHWFKEVNGPVTYFVVKPTASEGDAP
ncbi:MAG: heme-binding protein [Chromatiales bacterium]